jgi:hypothetical protein
MTGLDLIAAERQRQIEKGYDAEHDDLHDSFTLPRASVAFLYAAKGMAVAAAGFWPWPLNPLNPKLTPIELLTRAGAMVAAEIDRRLREEEGPQR